MEKAENEENNTTTPVNNPPLLYPLQLEFCTLCTQYVFAYIFHLKQVLKKSLLCLIFLRNKKNFFHVLKVFKASDQ